MTRAHLLLVGTLVGVILVSPWRVAAAGGVVVSGTLVTSVLRLATQEQCADNQHHLRELASIQDVNDGLNSAVPPFSEAQLLQITLLDCENDGVCVPGSWFERADQDATLQFPRDLNESEFREWWACTNDEISKTIEAFEYSWEDDGCQAQYGNWETAVIPDSGILRLWRCGTNAYFN